MSSPPFRSAGDSPVLSDRRIPPSCAWFLALLLTVQHIASAAPSDLRLETLATGLGSITSISNAGDSRVFITEKTGRMLVFDRDHVLPEPVLDLSSLVSTSNEQGLLSAAFHPSFADNGYFYVYYTDLNDDSVLARYRMSEDEPNVADPDSVLVVMFIDQPGATHNAGQLQFGPDGFLYLSLGDGVSAGDMGCRAQRTDTPLGKILRIDVDTDDGTYTAPPSNPFHNTGPFLDEVWAVGLRNPWRFSFDRLTGDLYVGDVGWQSREEIDFQLAGSPGGENYGWRIMEGTLCIGRTAQCPGYVPQCDDPAFTPPILEYPHTEGCAVIGGYVYRGPRLPTAYGSYFFGDLCKGWIRCTKFHGGERVVEELPVKIQGLITFGEDAEGELYLGSLDGGLFRLAAVSTNPGIIEFTGANFDTAEGAGMATITVRRTRGSAGKATVRYRTADDSAIAGLDYEATAGSLSWADGDVQAKSFDVRLFDDAVPENTTALILLLEDATGSTLGDVSQATLLIRDDDGATDPCVANASTMCLLGGRFRVNVDWQTTKPSNGMGQSVPLTDSSGFFWFFNPDNIEVVVKLVDACGARFDRYWVFAAGLTDLEIVLTIVDTDTGSFRTYHTDPRTPFPTILDTDAFATCSPPP